MNNNHIIKFASVLLVSAVCFSQTELSFAKSNSEIRKELKNAVAGKSFALGRKGGIKIYLNKNGIAYSVDHRNKITPKRWGIKFFRGQLQICVTFSNSYRTISQCGTKAYFAKHLVGKGDVYKLSSSRVYKK